MRGCRAELLDQFVKVHQLVGIIHLDISTRNILKRDGSLRIIDWAEAKPHDGDCVWSYGFKEHIEDVMPAFDEEAGQCFILTSIAHDIFWNKGECLRVMRDGLACELRFLWFRISPPRPQLLHP